MESKDEILRKLDEATGNAGCQRPCSPSDMRNSLCKCDRDRFSILDEYAQQMAIEWDLWKHGQYGLIFDGIHYVDRSGNVYTPSELYQIFLNEKQK